MNDPEAVVRWYVALTAVAALYVPVVAWLGAGLGVARYALVRPVGMAIAAALVWWPALAFGAPFTREVVAWAAVAAGVVGGELWRRPHFAGFHLGGLLAFEALWVLAFGGYAWMRGFNPDIAATEKPMEIALLSAIVRSSAVPAPDPWLAGETINYYYFGYQMMATVAKVAGVPAAIAFNLALATLFASCAVVAAGVGLRLAMLAGAGRRLALAAAAAGPVALLLAGNLETARRLARDASGTVHAGWWDGVGWQASRIIVDTGVHGSPDPRPTINEFPAFSFVLGDLHPHVLTYPLLAAVLALAIGIATSDAGRAMARMAVVGGLVGLLYASNSWDAPAGLLLVVGAIALVHRANWRAALQPIGAVLIGAAVVAAPFLLTFTAPVGVANPDVPGWLARIPVLGRVFDTFGIVAWSPSSFREIVTVHGLWICSCWIWLGVSAARDERVWASAMAHRDALLIAASVTLGLAIVWMPALVLIGWPLTLSLWVAVASARSSDRLVGGLYTAGFVLVLAPEFVYIQDVFADRMNTVFKLYFQAWLVLSVAAVAGFARVLATAGVYARIAASVAAMLLLAVALPYAPLSLWDWNAGFHQRRGLDGSAYISIAGPGDYAAITFVREHAEPGDVIVEAPGCSYGSYAGVPLSRVSAFTGIPTLLGWHGHESQWRRGDERALALLGVRADDANAILSAAQVAASDGTQPRFVIVGRQELEGSPGCSLSRARDSGIYAQLGNAGWVEAFAYAEMRVFVRADDALARTGASGKMATAPGRR